MKPWLQHYPDWTPHHLDYGDTTLVDQYERTVAAHPDRTATIFFGCRRSYREIGDMVESYAAGLRDLGVQPGDRVALLLPNCPQHLAAFYAVLRIGATVVEHNPLYTTAELQHPFADHGARVAIVWDKAVPTVEPLRRSTPLDTIIAVSLLDDMPRLKRWALRLPVGPLRAARGKLSGPVPAGTMTLRALQRRGARGGGGVGKPTAADTALILYTSGTTGVPKGAKLSHGNLVANLLQGQAWVPGLGADAEEPEVLLAALPMFHAYGLTMTATLGMAIAGTLVMLPAPEMPLLMEAMRRYHPTWVPGVPTLYQRIVEEARRTGTDVSGVRHAFSGASTLPTEVVEAWEELAGGLLVEGYGLTETSPIIVGNPMTPARRPGYVGIPFPDTDIRIANPEDPSEERPIGEAGEVLVRGPQVFTGYLNAPEATAAAFHDGWFRTGDMGVMEADGFLRLVSRIKEMIITGGFNVYPVEVEDALRAHPAIADCAVVGRPRADGSDTVIAVYTLTDAGSAEPAAAELRDWCGERLARYKIPRAFHAVAELPRDQMGKIRRREVRVPGVDEALPGGDQARAGGE